MIGKDTGNSAETFGHESRTPGLQDLVRYWEELGRPTRFQMPAEVGQLIVERDVEVVTWYVERVSDGRRRQGVLFTQTEPSEQGASRSVQDGELVHWL